MAQVRYRTKIQKVYHPKPISPFQPHPLRLVYASFLKGSECEVDLNLVKYFEDEEDVKDMVTVPYEEVRRNFSINGLHIVGTFSGNVMVVGSDPTIIRPYIPLLEDVIGMAPEPFMVWVEWLMRRHGVDVAPIPHNVSGVIDPKPVLDFAATPIYSIPATPSDVFLASFMDAVHVMQVHDVAHWIRFDVFYNFMANKGSRARVTQFVRYHKVGVYGELIEDAGLHLVPFELGSNFVLWNARGMTRPSFLHSLYVLVQTLDLVVIIVTEARITSDLLTDLSYDLPDDYSFAHFGPAGRAGGVVMLWFTTKVHPVYTPRAIYKPRQLLRVNFKSLFDHPSTYLVPFDIPQHPDSVDWTTGITTAFSLLMIQPFRGLSNYQCYDYDVGGRVGWGTDLKDGCSTSFAFHIFPDF